LPELRIVSSKRNHFVLPSARRRLGVREDLADSAPAARFSSAEQFSFWVVAVLKEQRLSAIGRSIGRDPSFYPLALKARLDKAHHSSL
jgi:hypothetical protein